MGAPKTTMEREPCPDFARAVREASADASLFAQVVACFEARLARFAAYTCKSRALGEDAFQDAMVVALDKVVANARASRIPPGVQP